MIIDCHVHLNNYHVEETSPAKQQLERLREQMTKHSLDHCIVLTSYIVNEFRPSAADLVPLVQDDARLTLVEGVGVTGDARPDWEAIAQRLRDGQVRGLKLYPGYEHLYPHDKAFRPAIELAGKYQVPVMIHTGDTYAPGAKLKYAHPIHVDELAVDYPEVTFVICHAGNPWLRDTAELMYKNNNVYADISGMVLEEFTAPLESFMASQVRDLILYSGEPDKLLFGTDWPLVRMGPYLRFVEALGLEPEQRAMLLGENAARLFRLRDVTRRTVPGPLEPAEPGRGPSPRPPTKAAAPR